MNQQGHKAEAVRLLAGDPTDIAAAHVHALLAAIPDPDTEPRLDGEWLERFVRRIIDEVIEDRIRRLVREQVAELRIQERIQRLYGGES